MLNKRVPPVKENRSRLRIRRVDDFNLEDLDRPDDVEADVVVVVAAAVVVVASSS